MKQVRTGGRKYMSLRSKLTGTLMFVTVLVIVYTAVVAYFLAADEVSSVSMRLSEENTESAGKNLNALLSEMAEQSNTLMALDSLHQMAELTDPHSSAAYARYDRDIIAGIFALQGGGRLSTLTNFEFVDVYLQNGYVCTQTHNNQLPFSTYEDCVAYFSAHGADLPMDGYTSGQWVACFFQKNGEQYLVYLRFIYEKLTLNKIGILVFGMADKTFSRNYAGYAPESFIINEDGTIMSATSRSAAQLGVSISQQVLPGLSGSFQSAVTSITYADRNGDRKIASCYPIYNMHAYLVAPFEYYEGIRDEGMRGFMRSMLLIGAIGLLLAYMLERFFSRSLSRSTTAITEFVHQVEDGKRELRYEPRGRDEIAMVGETINGMLDQLERYHMLREKDLRASQEMELLIMQQQINPHLLYNTLDSVLWVLQQNRYDEAEQLLGALSGFFKISLSRGRQMVPLQDELQLIDHYLKIQHLARNKNIHLESEIAGDLLNYPILKLSIQPLVENCIIHGFSGYRDDGQIRIEARREGDEVAIRITDNGIGMLEEEVSEVNAVLAETERPESFQHFGLFNISRRIAQKYGKQYGLHVESELSLYTEVTMRLPWQDAEEKRE